MSKEQKEEFDIIYEIISEKKKNKFYSILKLKKKKEENRKFYACKQFICW